MRTRNAFLHERLLSPLQIRFHKSVKKDNEAIQAHKALQQDANWDSFLDFYCPQCTVPVRVYYFIEEMTGSQNRAYGIRMEFIIEGIRERGEVE